MMKNFLFAILGLFLVAQAAATQQAGSVKKSARGGVEMVYVPAGEFIMGNDDKAEKPMRNVQLDGYWIGKNDVTVAQFRAYCDATGYKYDWARQKPDWGWLDDHPMVKVTWDEARAYCRWAGGDLPTEAQWEKAARGTDGRTYPWGNEFDDSRCWSSVGAARSSTAPVGSIPGGASPYGCLDMAYNVWQWCFDWYSADGYEDLPIRNPAGVPFGTRRILRGGSWRVNTPMRSSFRFSIEPTSATSYTGFRLATMTL